MADTTIVDVAHHAGVSIATVSRVLNDLPGVRPKTIEKVKKAVLECHYVPKQFSRSVNYELNKVIGILVSDITNSHFSSLSKVVSSVMHEYGYRVVICSTNDDPGQELDLLQQMVDWHICGLILNTTSRINDFVIQLSQNIPIVLIERNINSDDFKGDCISSNNQSGVAMLTQQMLQHGHRKIGIINAVSPVSSAMERFSGFVQTMKSVDITVDSDYPYLYTSEHFNMDGGFLGGRYLMNLPNPPTGIIATNNSLALGLYKYLRINQIKVPEKVSVLSYGNIVNSELLYIAPGFVTLDPFYIGDKAARCLLSRIADPDLRNRSVIFEPSLSPCNSVATIL